MKNSTKQYFAEIISTVLYIGKIPFAPGTFGSLSAFPLFWCLTKLISFYKISFNITNFTNLEQELAATSLLTLILCFVLFVIGIYCSNIYVKPRELDDPSEIVIDELVGQLLVLSLCVFATAFAHNSNISTKLNDNMIGFIFNFLLPFSLFRFFDICKPWPIKWFDKHIKGGLGIMLDDVIASIFAVFMHYAITFLMMDLF